MNTIKCNGILFDVSRPKVMGILNVTPDSFFDGGKYRDTELMKFRIDQLIEEGASIIDVGGMSSRPGAEIISKSEELKRVTPAIQYLNEHYPQKIVSIDTLHSEVAKEAVNMGANMINDISGGDFDSNMLEVVSESNVPLVIMHMQGNPDNMQKAPRYNDVVLDVIKYFVKKLRDVKKIGIKDVIIDPGFGFGKLIEHNYKLLNHLSSFKILEKTLLVGLSRKSMIYRPLSISPQNALNATTAAHMLALQNGANILRVHDVKQAMECISIFELSETYK